MPDLKRKETHVKKANRHWIHECLIKILFSSNSNISLIPTLLCLRVAKPTTNARKSQTSCQAGKALRCQNKGGRRTICQPSLCPLRPLGQRWALKPSSPSAHLNPHDNRSRPYYSSRLAGGYLLLWQPACCKSGKLEGRARVCQHVWESE